MRKWITAFSCGVILLYCVGVIPPLMLLLGGFLLLLFVFCVTSSQTLAFLAPIGCSLLLGLSWSAWLANERLSEQLPADLEGQVMTVRGYLCDIPSPGNFDSIRIRLCVTEWPALDGDPGIMPSQLRLAWYGDNATLELPHRMQVDVVLKKPHGTVNPEGFRYETWLYREGYRATGTVRQVTAMPGLDCGLRCQYHLWRNAWYQTLHRQFSGSEHRAFAEALLMGYRGGITPDQWQVLQATGTVHLMAISGLHLGLIAMVVAVLVRFLLVRLPAHWLSPSRHRMLAAWVVVLVCLGYSLLAGFTVPTRRALVMVSVACWTMVSRRQPGIWTGWLVALFLTLVMDPFSVLDRGFWLSFGAVAVLMLVFSRWYRRCHWLVIMLLAQLAVSVGLWPILAVLGQPQVTLGMPANMLAIPWVSFLVMPVLMVGGGLAAVLPGTAELVGQSFDWVFGVLWRVLSWLAGHSSPLPGGGWAVPFALAALILVPLVVPVRAARWLALAVAVFWGVTGFVRSPLWSEGNRYVAVPEIWVWDVGQGLSVLVRHQNKVLVYDTGPESPGGYNAVKSVLLPNLARLGVRRIDTLVLSHGDADHVGGLDDLLTGVRVGRIVSGEPERVRSRLRGDWSITACANQPAWQIGGVRVDPWQYHPLGNASSNDHSCVLVVRYAGVELVLPGDITQVAERRFLADMLLDRTRYRMLLAPHHGSRSSSGVDWVDGLQADLVIFSAGYRHRFGHPHPEVVRRYGDGGSRLINTAESGGIAISLTPSGPEVTTARERVPFWIEGYALDDADH